MRQNLLDGGPIGLDLLSKMWWRKSSSCCGVWRHQARPGFGSLSQSVLTAPTETGGSGHIRSAKEVEVVRRAGGRVGSLYSIAGVCPVWNHWNPNTSDVGQSAGGL